MRKEVVYAIIAGVVLGLVVAYGVYRINSEVAKNKNATNPIATPSPTPTAVTKEFKVVLSKPNQNDVTTESSINVAGITKQSSWVAVIGEDRDYFFKSDASGGFSKDVNLIPGVNQIKVVAFDSTGKQSEAGVLIVYSSTFVLKSGDTQKDPNASSEADIKKQVAANLTNALNTPKAYIGTVTDVTDATIEIKTKTGEIQQISITADGTAVINATGTNNKTVKTTDIAIGDFVVAMGYIGGNSVLSAQRVLITDALTDSNTQISMAKVTAVTKKALTVSTMPDSNQKTVTPDTKTSVSTFKEDAESTIKFATLAKDDTVIYTELTDAKNNTRTRSVFLTPESPTQ